MPTAGLELLAPPHHASPLLASLAGPWPLVPVDDRFESHRAGLFVAGDAAASPYPPLREPSSRRGRPLPRRCRLGSARLLLERSASLGSTAASVVEMNSKAASGCAVRKARHQAGTRRWPSSGHPPTMEPSSGTGSCAGTAPGSPAPRSRCARLRGYGGKVPPPGRRQPHPIAGRPRIPPSSGIFGPSDRGSGTRGRPSSQSGIIKPCTSC